MSDSDTPPPVDGPSQPSFTSSIPTAAPSTAGISLGQGKLPENDEKTMSMLAHILGGVTCIVGPLLIWLLKKDDSPFVNDQGKEALNFQITVLIAYVVSGIIAAVTCIGGILYLAVAVASLVLGIRGGLEANKGKPYRYPFALRLIS